MHSSHMCSNYNVKQHEFEHSWWFVCGGLDVGNEGVKDSAARCAEFKSCIVATLAGFEYNTVCGWETLNKHKLVTGECGHPVTKLVYFKCTYLGTEVCWTCTVKIHTVFWQGYYTSTHLVSEEVLYQLKLQKAALYMYEYREGELHNCSLSFEVILCTGYILWITCLLISYFNQQNALNQML